jgi:hypothetical protein
MAETGSALPNSQACELDTVVKLEKPIRCAILYTSNPIQITICLFMRSSRFLNAANELFVEQSSIHVFHSRYIRQLVLVPIEVVAPCHAVSVAQTSSRGLMYTATTCCSR